MRSQELRKLGPEIDPLKLSMDWTPEDLDLPQVLVDDVWGDALPGSYHLKELSDAVSRGVFAGGGKPALFHVTDMCDGIAQGTEGMNFSTALAGDHLRHGRDPLADPAGGRSGAVVEL